MRAATARRGMRRRATSVHRHTTHPAASQAASAKRGMRRAAGVRMAAAPSRAAPRRQLIRFPRNF
jgi:hypothetical protein